MIIKNILNEELENSLRMKARYEQELAKLPRGSLVRRTIKGHDYYYLVLREEGKFKSIYKGRSVSVSALKKYARAKELRAKYRKSLSLVKKQVRFLKGAVRGKEAL